MFSLVIGLLVAAPVVGFAAEQAPEAKYTLSLTQDFTPSEWTDETGYVDRAREKLVFGGKNTLLGWMELYNEPRDAVRAENHSFWRGMGKGLVNMIGDTIGGAAHVATFPITAVDVCLPVGGTDLL
jgi:hypothetical protein